MKIGEIYDKRVLAKLPSGKLVDVTDIDPLGITMEQLEALPAVEDKQIVREAATLTAIDISERPMELRLEMQKMEDIDYIDPLVFEEQQEGWHTCHEYSKCKRGSSSKPHVKPEYWHRVRSFCVSSSYH